jgi:cellobiose phosphorylase
MYRLGIEGILGVRREGESLAIRPTIPAEWAGFKLVYRYGSTVYHISVVREAVDERELLLDDELLTGDAISLVDDGAHHAVVVHLPLGTEAQLF